MIDTKLAYFIQNIPLAELHLHIEGSLQPELMFKLAKRNNIKIGSDEFPFKSVDEIRAAYKFTDLQSFLDIYYKGANVLRTEQDFYDLAMDYFARADADNVRHTEIFFDPQTHTDPPRNIPYATVIEGLSRAARDAEKHFGMSISLIHSFLRHLPESAAFASLEMAKPYLNDPHYKIIGVGLDSSELGHPPSKFKNVFAAAKALGLHIMAHAGEEGPPEYVREALDILQVERIDHGNRSLEDAALAQDLVARGMTLTVCPLSNKELRVTPDLTKHPIPEMLKLGMKATLHSDDPAYFGGYIKDNFMALAELGLIGYAEVETLARNSITGSFMSDEQKAKHLARIDAFVKDHAPQAVAAKPTKPVAKRKRRLSGPEA